MACMSLRRPIETEHIGCAELLNRQAPDQGRTCNGDLTNDVTDDVTDDLTRGCGTWEEGRRGERGGRKAREEAAWSRQTSAAGSRLSSRLSSPRYSRPLVCACVCLRVRLCVHLSMQVWVLRICASYAFVRLCCGWGLM